MEFARRAFSYYEMDMKLKNALVSYALGTRDDMEGYWDNERGHQGLDWRKENGKWIVDKCRDKYTRFYEGFECNEDTDYETEYETDED
jgi:hypothetical protein